ncbi:MAG: hypothetical protein NT175_05625 [Bacteroidetes bacterium]|nr:hypothetical protein [Bacteroidota bacterium]
MRKAILTFTLLLFSVAYLYSQLPVEISLQSTIKDKDGKIIPNQTVTIKITIIETGVNGEIVYCELHNPLTDQNGVVSLPIGRGEVQTGDFISLNWNTKSYVLKTTCNTPQGTPCKLYGTSQLLSYKTPTAGTDKSNEDLCMPGNMYSTPGMLILAPPERIEEWMFEPTKVNPSNKP